MPIATLFWAAPVRVVARSNVNKNGPGARLDGVVLAKGNRLLLVAQAQPIENGIWVFDRPHTPLQRPSDYAGTAPGAGMTVVVTEGSCYAHTTWRILTTGVITVDSTPVSFGQLEELLNVLQFGARGDGETDDTQAIQAALTVAAQAPFGGAVFLPAGAYFITRSLEVGNSTTLQGVGPASVILTSTASAFPAITNRDHGFGNHDLTIKDLAIDGRRPNATTPPAW